MNNTDKIVLKIKIGEERLMLNIPFDGQDDARDAEKIANDLFKRFRLKFPSATDAGILARVAYRLAANYLEAAAVNARALDLAEEAEKKIGSLISEEMNTL